MKLIDLLSVVDEYTKQVDVCDTGTGEVLSSYNGRDNIESMYNHCEVDEIHGIENGLIIYIKLEG